MPMETVVTPSSPRDRIPPNADTAEAYGGHMLLEDTEETITCLQV